jgi:hypothetical protein
MALTGMSQPRRVRGRHRLTAAGPSTRPGLIDAAFLASGYLARCVSALVILSVIGSVTALATPDQQPEHAHDPAATVATHRRE